MKDTVTLDAAGRVLIPTALRDALHLAAGDTMELDADGDRVTLRPVRAGASVQKERGVWVFRRGGAPITNESINRALSDLRESGASRNTDADL